ncbi:MAG: VOC family protein [Janthinobacterium lividum]
MTVQRLSGIVGFRLVTADLGRLTRFYRDVLEFATAGLVEPIGSEEMALLGLPGIGRRQRLEIGEQTLSVDEFEVAGHPYPLESNAASPWFQHLALVVPNIGAAYGRLRDIAPITQGGPWHLPPSSGSVHAFKFRDPDGHPLELLQFPESGTLPAWKGRAPVPGQMALGIDHSAISVGDLDASLAFYAGLGLAPGQQTLNRGAEQQNLDDLRDVDVRVQPMRPSGGTSHLELLAYRVPPAQGIADLRANDVAATRIVWRGTSDALLRDPDGHLQQVEI